MEKYSNPPLLIVGERGIGKVFNPLALSNYGDSTFRDRKSSAAIMLLVVADHGFGRNFYTFINDCPTDFRMSPNIDSVEKDRVVNFCKTVDSGVGTQDRLLCATS